MSTQTVHSPVSPDEQFLTFLSERNRLTSVPAERVRRVQLETMDRLASVLLKLGVMSEEDLANDLALFGGIERAGEEALSATLPAEGELNLSFLRAHELILTE